MSPKKQGTLFSFFAKKPSPAKKACASSSKTLASKLPVRPSSSTEKDHSKESKFETNGSKKIKNKSKQEDLLRRVSVGSTLSIYWPDDKKYYNAKVTSMGNSGSAVTLLYDDGEVETVDLSGERFKVLSETTTEAAGSPTSEAQEPVPVTQESSKKKRRVIEDESEEEFEFEDDVEDGDSDASEFIADDVSEDEEDLDESVMITDEDEEKIIDLKTRKRVRVSEVKNPYEKPSKKVATVDAKRAKSASFVTPPPKKKANLSSNSFAAFASPRSLNKFQSPSQPRNLSTNDLTPLPSLKSPHKSQSQKAVGTRIPLPIEKTVNSAGTHYHNHFSFLLDENRRDAKNRLVSHPEYDRRTLRIDYEEIRKVTKNKITPASEQWWKIKSQYADTILLFKTGKFYEIFHMDADIAVQVLGFSYMKGTVAHAGFPEVGYGAFCEKLVRAGYKVARVEQTETPDMLKERKKRTSGKKPQVVNREVCSIVSAGTRTFCYMDDIKGLENEEFDGSIGPLLAIKEILVSDAKETEGDELKPACEFGVTIIDAARGTITLGQFADDMLYSRMNTLLTRFRPSEILVQSGGDGAASDTLHSLLKSIKGSLLPSCRVELIGNTLTFPKSTAIQSEIRAKIDRPSTQIKPWDVQETLTELHRKLYFPRSSRKTISPGDIAQGDGISRWPKTLQACIMGGANLALSSLGAALFYLQRSLIDEEILSMGIIKPYFPPEPTSLGDAKEMKDDSKLKGLAEEEDREESGVELNPHQNTPQFEFSSHEKDYQNLEKETNYMSLDGTTIANLEILSNIHSNTSVGSLWSKINFTKTPFGGRLLRAWLLRPLFKKADIDRRADAVEELMSGGAAAAMSEARAALAKCGDIERLLSRVHSMVGNGSLQERQHHPNERAVLYETAKHTKRKVEDFSRLLNGLRAASRIAEMFADVDIQSGMLQKIVKTTDNGGCLHPKITENLDWFFDNFDAHAASRGLFEPTKGIDENYDAAVDEVERIKQELDDYKDSICSELLKPSHVAKREWKYINTKADSKDKYLIELPVSVQVPGEFIVKGKRGKGQRQINKYRTFFVEQRLEELEIALEAIKLGKERGMQLIFAKFLSMRSLWASLAQATAMLDALAALSEASSRSGFSRPQVCDCTPNDSPHIDVKQGRHPCVDFTHNGGDFIPNDLILGGTDNGVEGSRILLLSGPNMGGKSTLLRQTCLIAILAQIGCFVPAEECTLTPFDRIFTRLGASDRILLGQSTFFVELAETAAALRGATRRSLVIMDELGRGTSTFDGTAIASASVKHLVERNKCLTLFATHYHSLLEDWKDRPSVRLGHMECIVEGEGIDSLDDENLGKSNDGNITFLYTLGVGTCPKSFGINVARLAAIPSEILSKAREVSSSFESTMIDGKPSQKSITRSSTVITLSNQLQKALKEEKWDLLESLWTQLNNEDVI